VSLIIYKPVSPEEYMNQEITKGKNIEFNRTALENKKTKILVLSHENIT
jgi:hypothetical protein